MPGDLGDNGGGFINVRSEEEAAAARMHDMMAELREEMGEEAFARWQRSEELSGSPRPLTSSERDVLRRAAGPLLADLAASRMPLPDIRDEAHEERDGSACGWIQGPGRTGEGFSVRLDCSPVEQLAELAEQIQDWAADQLYDAGRPPGWPGCPRHPSPPHRLEPVVVDDRAVWECPESGELIWPIGELALPGGASRGQRDKRG